MTTNRLATPAEPQVRNGAPSDPEERRRYWIERGNMLLAQEGKGHLEWVWRNGSYAIEPRR